MKDSLQGRKEDQWAYDYQSDVSEIIRFTFVGLWYEMDECISD